MAAVEQESGEGETEFGAHDSALTFEVQEHVAEAIVVDAESGAQLCAGDGGLCASECVDDEFVEGRYVGSGRSVRGVGGVRVVVELEVRCAAVGERDEAQLDRVLCGSGSVLEGESEFVC